MKSLFSRFRLSAILAADAFQRFMAQVFWWAVIAGLIMAAFAIPAQAGARQNVGSYTFEGDRYVWLGGSAGSGRPRTAETRRVHTHQRTGAHEHRARRTVERHRPSAWVEEAVAGIVKSAKTGAVARVATRYASRFQGYIDKLEAAGASIYYMGGIRPGRCSSGSQHPCGKALDVCQDSRGRVSGEKDCHLPEPAEMAQIAKDSGLHEGAVWCSNPDYGHAQVDKTGSDCPARGLIGHGHGHYLASMTGKIVTASAAPRRRHAHHHSRRIRLARR